MAAMKVRNIVVISNITVSNTERTRNRNTFQSHCVYLMAACQLYIKPLRHLPYCGMSALLDMEQCVSTDEDGY